MLAGSQANRTTYHPYKDETAFDWRSEQLEGGKARNMVNIWLMHRHMLTAMQDCAGVCK